MSCTHHWLWGVCGSTTTYTWVCLGLGWAPSFHFHWVPVCGTTQVREESENGVEKATLAGFVAQKQSGMLAGDWFNPYLQNKVRKMDEKV